MRKVHLSLIGTFVFVLFASTASAQDTRTWVSGVGDDANPCSRTAPCKTFAGAISKTAACGEISVLDPGGFGAVTITKSITINGTGTLASILSSSTNGVLINISNPAASTCGGKVYLLNLSINGAGTGLSGVKILSAGGVTIEGLSIFGMGGSINNHGIFIDNDVNPVDVQIHNTTLRNISGQAIFAGGLQQSNLSLSNVRVFDNARSGLNLNINSKATVYDSVFTNNTGTAIFVESASTEAAIFNSILSRNFNGVHVGNAGGGTVRLYGCQIFGNTGNAIQILPGGIASTHTNNAIIGNAGTQATNNSAGLQ